MLDRARVGGWWQTELQRDYTKLECGLLGALFASIAITFVMVMRFVVF